MVRAPRGQVGIVAEGHDAGRVGVTVGREFLHRHLRFAALRAAAERHQHGGTADRRIEHFDQAALRDDIVVAQVLLEAFGKRRAHDLTGKGIAVLHLTDHGFGIVLRPGAVDEFTREVYDFAPFVEHPHTGRIRHVGHLDRLDILLAAVFHEPGDVFRLDDYGHALLRLADRQFRGIQAAVLGLHAVEINIQPVGQLADGDADAAGAEVVRFLDEPRHLGAAEQAFEFALLGGIALLHLAAAGFERLSIVLFRRTRGAADTVTPRAATQHDNLVARDGFFAADVFSLHGTDHGTDFEALGHIVVVVNLAHMGRCQPDLIAVTGVARGGLLRNDALRELAFERIGHLLVDIAGTRYTHGLVDVAAPRQRVADSAAQTGRSAAERLDLGRVVMGFVLELQEPLLGRPVDIDIDVYRAGVVLVAHFQVVQQPFLAQVAGADGRHVHQADALVLAPQFAADAQVEGQRILDLVLYERFLDRDALQLGGEGRMAAMVAPIGVEDAQLGLIGIAPLGTEIFHHLAQVVGIHRQPVPLAAGFQFGVGHLGEAFQHGDGLHLGLFHVGQHVQILLTRLDRVDIVMADARQVFVGNGIVEQQQLRRADAHLGRRVDQPHAVDGRRGTLVELAGEVLHGDVFPSRQVARIGHAVGYHFAEDAVTALFEQLSAEPEQVVDVEQLQTADVQVQIGVQLPAQAVGLDPETGMFLNKNPVVFHVISFALILRICRPTRHRIPRRPSRRR